MYIYHADSIVLNMYVKSLSSRHSDALSVCVSADVFVPNQVIKDAVNSFQNGCDMVCSILLHNI